MIIQDISWQCFVYGHKLDQGGVLIAAKIGDLFPASPPIVDLS
jgi:hypothetical protein